MRNNQIKVEPPLGQSEFNRFRVSPLDPATLRVDDVQSCLGRIAKAASAPLEIGKFAESFCGRPIHLVTLGRGPQRVLLWSQMHGDEPTHTAVLLDLVSYLTGAPEEPLAADILSNSTLLVIPMLNPDGAELVSRFNAQHIDINRDARRLQTPEGRALWRAVQELNPRFAFGLHNQSVRTSVGTSGRPAAASVIAPPVDELDTETPQFRTAKQVAACFIESVRPLSDGMVSRYDADFMPRCFGEALQAAGVATITVEAGGLSDSDPTPMVRLHFHGLLATLHAIATDSFVDIDPEVYDALPRSNEHPLFDCMITNARLVDVQRDTVFHADLGINHSTGHRDPAPGSIGSCRVPGGPQKPDGRFVDIGDLSVTTGRTLIDAGGGWALPGGIAVLADWSPRMPLDDELIDSLLQTGTTTLIGSVDLADPDALEPPMTPADLPFNIGFVARIDDVRKRSETELVERVLWAVKQGVLAIVADSLDTSIGRCLELCGVPVLRSEQLPSAPPTTARSFYELATETSRSHALFGLDGDRGTIHRQHFADLRLFAVDGDWNGAAAVDWQHLRRVIVAGETVWLDGKRVGTNSGAVLRRSAHDGL